MWVICTINLFMSVGKKWSYIILLSKILSFPCHYHTIYKKIVEWISTKLENTCANWSILRYNNSMWCFWHLFWESGSEEHWETGTEALGCSWGQTARYLVSRENRAPSMETLDTKPKENFAFPSGQWVPYSSADRSAKTHSSTGLMN